MMKISVVIPAYNSEATIGRAITSVLAQTRAADEIIVVDDGSLDGTVNVIRDFGKQVTLIQQDNAGASVARNAGIEEASGNWIAFLDGDDEWLNNKLELQVAHLLANPDLKWTTGNYYRCHCDQQHRQVSDMSEQSIRDCRTFLSGREFFADYLKAYSLLAKGHTDTMLIQRKLLIAAGLFLPGQKRMNDIDMWFRLAYIEPQFGFIFEPLAIYHLDVENSIVKAHTDWRMIDEFLGRHFKLAEKAKRLDAFNPCAQIALRHWIDILMDKNQGRAIRCLLGSHPELIDSKKRNDLWRASWLPRLWKWRQTQKRRKAGDIAVKQDVDR
ncbi:MAG: glycosyltransferase family 2 protein [Planctomycetota bacterium]|jgi:glycosyltransferase involved in cell wall biosynthesis